MSIAVTAVVLASVLVCQAPAPGQSTDYVVIDGRKEPWKLPEWTVWESGFRTIALVQGIESAFTADLKQVLSEEEMALLEREANGQLARHDTAVAEVEKLRPLLELGRAGEQRINDETREINLRYRRATLAARDRVLGALTPESHDALLVWIAEVRTTIKATVSKDTLHEYLMPQ